MEQETDKYSKKRITIWEPGILILGFLLSIMAAAICMQIMGQFGIAPNTALIGAVLVMLVSKIPITMAVRLRNLERQNYVLSISSAAGFSAANCGFIAIATMFVLGRNDLIIPVSIGALVGSLIAVFIIGRIFDSRIFPATGPWPNGQAVATTVLAGNEGGKRGFQLVQGLIVGAVASFLGIPAAGIGIAFISNMVAIGAMAVGIVLRGYSPYLFGWLYEGFEISDTNIAQGVMIGAGFVAFIQIIAAITKGSKKAVLSQNEFYTSDKQVRNTLVIGVGLFMVGAVVIAIITGVFSDMGIGMSALWVVYSGFAAMLVMMLVGTSSMQAGWAPAFAVVTMCLTVGMLIGFPAMPLAVLVGYIGAVGLPMTDAAASLKAGWIIRGKGKDKEHEEFGRKQQIILKHMGVVIGIAMSILFGVALTQGGVIPPMSSFYAYTVREVVDIALLRELAIWSVPGMALQAIFGSKSVGLMLAAGLLIPNPILGITILVSLGLRLVIGTKHMNVRGPGLIAGDGLFGFGTNLFRMFF